MRLYILLCKSQVWEGMRVVMRALLCGEVAVLVGAAASGVMY